MGNHPDAVIGRFAFAGSALGLTHCEAFHGVSHTKFAETLVAPKNAEPEAQDDDQGVNDFIKQAGAARVGVERPTGDANRFHGHRVKSFLESACVRSEAGLQ